MKFALKSVLTNFSQANDCNLEIWETYVYWSIENDFIKNKDEERTAAVFADFKARCGNHPRSWGIWQYYAKFESMRNKKNNMNLIYYSAMRAQIKDLDDLMSEYTQFLEKNFNDVKELISREDAPDFKNEKPTLLNHFLESNNDKETFLGIINRLAEKVREEVNKRLIYESSLSTFSYALNYNQDQNSVMEKENWRSYIDMEKAEEDQQRVIMLYKRMLVPFYDDLDVWDEYIDYLCNTVKDVKACRDVFKYLRNSPVTNERAGVIDIYLKNADFEEKQGQISLARKIHKLVNEKISPNFIKTITEYIRFERRVGGPQKNILEFLERNLKTALRSEDAYATVFLTVNICRFHFVNDHGSDSHLLNSHGSNEDLKFTQTFTIIEHALLDQNSIFELADRVQIASLYVTWLKQNCSQQPYIESIEARLANIGRSYAGGATIAIAPTPADSHEDVKDHHLDVSMPGVNGELLHTSTVVPQTETGYEGQAYAGASTEGAGEDGPHKMQKTEE